MIYIICCYDIISLPKDFFLYFSTTVLRVRTHVDEWAQLEPAKFTKLTVRRPQNKHNCSRKDKICQLQVHHKNQ